MAEYNITNELLYETLKALRGDIARVEGKVDSVAVDVASLHKHVGGPVHSDMNRRSELEDLKSRVERIEQRLELVGDED